MNFIYHKMKVIPIPSIKILNKEIGKLISEKFCKKLPECEEWNRITMGLKITSPHELA